MKRILFILSYLQFIFLLYVGFQVYSTYGDIPIGTSISGIVAPILAWWAGTGLKGSLHVGTPAQKKGGVFMAILFSAISFYWINSTGYSISEDISLTGTQLLIVAFVLGFFGTTREISEIGTEKN
jgi:hypothetical protein